MFRNVIPEPYAALARIVAIAAVLVAASMYGYVKGCHHVQVKLDAFAAQVDRQAAAQLLHTVHIQQAQQRVTEDNQHEYQSSLADLNRYYADRLRRAPTPGGGRAAVPPVPDAPVRLDGTPDHPVLVTYPPADRSAIEHDCAVTTLGLVWLQRWVAQQQAANP